MQSKTDMRKFLSHVCAFCVVMLFPVAAYAAAPKNFKEVVNIILGYVRLLIPLLFGLTLLMLIWGIVRAWIFGAGNTEKIEQGQQIALWGVIGLVVAVGLWGLVALVRTSLFGNI